VIHAECQVCWRRSDAALARVETSESDGGPGDLGDVELWKSDDRAGSAQDGVAFSGGEAETSLRM